MAKSAKVLSIRAKYFYFAFVCSQPLESLLKCGFHRLGQH